VGGELNLIGYDTGSINGTTKNKAAAELLVADPLQKRQEQLYAEGQRSVLLVLQGMDTSGKDGTIKHVIGRMNPVGVDITSFKAPTPEEARHHFLWRVRRALPRPGQVGIFNRSHYEDVGITRVHQWIDLPTVERRYSEINRFEQQAAERGITLVKCFLHISYDEQRRRLLNRLRDPTKVWKFKASDIDERQRWDDYTVAYEAAIVACGTADAPWYIVPGDHKWYRNWAIARLLLETFDLLGLRYPKVQLDIPALEARLAPPH
jgi:PPK2 family polyphosphate:nucleotide phosphotransferase